MEQKAKRGGGKTKTDFSSYLDDIDKLTGGWFKSYEIKAVILALSIVLTKEWIEKKDINMPVLGHVLAYDHPKKGRYFYDEKRYDPDYEYTVRKLKQATSLLAMDKRHEKNLASLERKLGIVMKVVDRYSQTRMKFVKSLQIRKKCPQSL